MKDNPYRSPDFDDTAAKAAAPTRETSAGDMAIVGLVVGVVTGSATGGIIVGLLRICAIAWQLVSESQSSNGISVTQIAIGDVVAYVCFGALLGGVSGALIGSFAGLLAHWTDKRFRRRLLGISVAAATVAAVIWCLLFGLLTFGESNDRAQAHYAVATIGVILAAAVGGVRLGRRIAELAWRTSQISPPS